jgi:ribulose-phosphate 3-epimerase
LNNKELFVSTISDNPKNIFKNLQSYEKSGISGIHFDVMDGVFVPRFGLYPELLEAIKKETFLPVEVHLMVTNPEIYIERFVYAGADRIIVHYESLLDVNKFLLFCSDFKIEVGLAVNPKTSLQLIKDYLKKIDLILLMAINPGIPKHQFIPSTLNKLIDLKSLVDRLENKVKIGVDGGVTFENLQLLFANGANILICGSGTIFKNDNSLDHNLAKLIGLAKS